MNAAETKEKGFVAGPMCRSTRANGLDGGILILVLWTLFFLAALALAAAAYVGGQVEMARRLGGQVMARQAALAGVNHGLALLLQETNGWKALSEPWANKPEAFQNVTAGMPVSWTASYPLECADGTVRTNYGFSDEAGKIDVNFAREEVLASLFKVAAGLGEEQGHQLAKTIIEARMAPPPGQKGMSFARSSCWARRDVENGPFQSPYELLWINGMTRDIFNQIEPHITVYGGTRVNINTAGPMVWRVLAAVKGQTGGEDFIRKILQFRERGGIFKSLFGGGLAGAGGEPAELSAEVQVLLSGMAPYVTVTSDRFRGGVVAGQGASRVGISFVWDRRERRFLYWHED
jgi:type II secretory pathway component PulK